MAPEGIVEPVNVAANGLGSLLAGVEGGPPDKLGFEGLEERLDHGVVVAVSLAGHRDQDAVLAELGLIVDRTVLGGINWSSQHNREECCDGRETAVGSSVTGQVEVARAAGDGAT